VIRTETISGPTVAVVVPICNNFDLLERLFPAVVASSLELDATVVVADDASDDGSVEWIGHTFPSVKVIPGERRVGFGENCNRAVRQIEADVIVLLNSDVVVAQGFLEPLLAPFQGSPEVFSVSPSIILRTLQRDEAVNHFVFRYGLLRGAFPCIDGLPAPTSLSPIGYGVGAAVAIDREKFLTLGGFDPLFSPFYCEDMDLGFRAWRRGWSCLYQPASRVTHEHRATIEPLVGRTRLHAIHFRNLLLFNWKNLRDTGLIIRHLGWLFRYPASFVLHRSGAELRGYGAAWLRFALALRARRNQGPGLDDREIITISPRADGELTA